MTTKIDVKTRTLLKDCLFALNKKDVFDDFMQLKERIKEALNETNDNQNQQ